MNITPLIIDLFAGPGGWEEGAQLVGVPGRILGIEWDEAACATARAAGHARMYGDVAEVAVGLLGPITGLIASPPCQAYSVAGKQLGKLDRPRIEAHIAAVRTAGRWLDYPSGDWWHDQRSPLVLEPLRWALLGEPDWIACEQVPAVLPLWQLMADVLAQHGYSTAVGTLSAEQYGVPQTRQRAILVASCVGPAALPAPTHQAYTKRKPFDPDSLLPRWVSMAEALGWDDAALIGFARRSDGRGEVVTIDGEAYRGRDLRRGSEPAQVVTEKARSWTLRANANANATIRAQDEPAPTITAGHDSGDRVWALRSADWVRDSDETHRVTVEEAAILQSVRPDYPWQGSRTKQYEQVGNVIPPLLAVAVLGNLLDLAGWREVCMSMRPETTDEQAVLA